MAQRAKGGTQRQLKKHFAFRPGKGIFHFQQSFHISVLSEHPYFIGREGNAPPE